MSALPAEKINILLVDDSEDDFLLVKRMLSGHKDRFSLAWTDSYDKALVAMLAKEYEVYLIDYRLGANDGLDLLKTALAQGCSAPIIILTGMLDPNIDNAALYSGAADYLVKDEVTAPLLVRSIRYSLEHARRAERERALIRQQEALKQAQDLNRMKDDFLTVISHELRRPLTSIIGWVQMLRTRKLDEATTVCGLATIENCAKAQAQLVDDLLDISRTIMGKLRIEQLPVDLVTVVESAMRGLQDGARAKEISIRTIIEGGSYLISGDPLRLQQVCWHLIANAVKFTPRGGQIEVELRREGEQAVMEVRDNGYGISAEVMPHIFERFRQADSSNSRLHGGLGLGLAIARSLVELHGGQIEAHSAGLDQGATFTVRLPLYEKLPYKVAQAAAAAAKPASTMIGENRRELNGVRVIVVDDEPDIVTMLKVTLSARGAEVRVASSTAEAVNEMNRWWPDLLITDLGMPGDDGYELLKMVHAIRPLPTVALTAYVGVEHEKRTRTAGFNAHVAKPFDPDRLVSVIANLIKPHNL